MGAKRKLAIEPGQVVRRAEGFLPLVVVEIRDNGDVLCWRNLADCAVLVRGTELVSFSGLDYARRMNPKFTQDQAPPPRKKCTTCAGRGNVHGETCLVCDGIGWLCRCHGYVLYECPDNNPSS